VRVMNLASDAGVSAVALVVGESGAEGQGKLT
jgi:hypothetical protein